jgi:hypothetical protein
MKNVSSIDSPGVVGSVGVSMSSMLSFVEAAICVMIKSIAKRKLSVSSNLP